MCVCTYMYMHTLVCVPMSGFYTKGGRVLYKGRDPGIYPDLLPSELNIHYIKEGNIKTSIMKSTKVQTLGTI